MISPAVPPGESNNDSKLCRPVTCSDAVHAPADQQIRNTDPWNYRIQNHNNGDVQCSVSGRPMCCDLMQANDGATLHMSGLHMSDAAESVYIMAEAQAV